MGRASLKIFHYFSIVGLTKKKALKYYFEFELSKSLSHKVLKYTVLMKINY